MIPLSWADPLGLSMKESAYALAFAAASALALASAFSLAILAFTGSEFLEKPSYFAYGNSSPVGFSGARILPMLLVSPPWTLQN